MRLNKYLASCGLGSRRACEQLIANGIVTVNDEDAQGPFQQVDPSVDRVAVAAETVRPPRHAVYILLNKPRGYLTTVSDPESRRTVMSLIPRTPERLFPVGRLDRDSEGLLLLTSDGETANRLAHPRHGIERFYRVEVSTPFPAGRLQDLEHGAFVDGELLAVAKARLSPPGDQGKRLELVLVTGKKREIRRLLEAMGFTVTRVFRYGFGPIRLGDLPVGKTRRLAPAEIRHLKETVGLRD
ncbi:MAG: rRNA pseudouridine synthase [Candidatus Eisenbacteria bacterium]|jgi:pseudouridine synthase|nr:rRNA pseudouridine synthase [Candidatus Eisenbacteria bacterium]